MNIFQHQNRKLTRSVWSLQLIGLIKSRCIGDLTFCFLKMNLRSLVLVWKRADTDSLISYLTLFFRKHLFFNFHSTSMIVIFYSKQPKWRDYSSNRYFHLPAIAACSWIKEVKKFISLVLLEPFFWFGRVSLSRFFLRKVWIC